MPTNRIQARHDRNQLRQGKGKATYERVVYSAAVVFARKGYSNTTLNDIANEASTQPGSLYYHFASRDAIVSAVLEKSVEVVESKVIPAVLALGSEASYREKIELGIRTHLALNHAQAPFLAAYDRILDEVPAQLRDELHEAVRPYSLFWKDLFERAQEAGEIRSDLEPGLIRLLIFDAISGTRAWLKKDGPLSLDEVADQILTLFFEGVDIRSNLS